MLYFILAFILSLLLSFATYKLAVKKKWLDYADGKRKLHAKPTPNLGGVAMFLSFLIVTILFLYFNNVTGAYFKYVVGLMVGALVLFVTGVIDDRKKINPAIKFAVQIISALIVIASGVGITYINNPFGGFIFLDQIKIPILNISGTIYQITLFADIFALLWIVGTINVVNFLDGLDGLASGVAVVSFLAVYLLSISPAVNQPLSAIVALILLGAILGFIPFNLNPAKMFMGDSGSMFLGFTLATVAIVSGGKVATALLVLGLPIFDGLWVATSRLIHKRKPWEAGRDHLHHKLVDLGLSKRGVVLVFWFITALFGIISLMAGARGKMIALIVLVLILIIGTSAVNLLSRNPRRGEPPCSP